MAKYSPILDDAEWFIGEDKVLAFTITNDAGVEKDMSGKTVEFVMRHEEDGPVVLAVAGTISGAVVNVAITRAMTVNGSGNFIIDPGTYYYALRQTNANDSEVLAFGPIVLRLGATR